jgi:HSP20 family molecular chaperone IbpA
MDPFFDTGLNDPFLDISVPSQQYRPVLGGRRPVIGGMQQQSLLPAHTHCDVMESDTIYCITSELAGVAKDKLSVEIDNNSSTLTITADKDEVLHGPETGTWVHRATERSFGKIIRSFRLPSYVDMDSATTCFCDGLLKVHFKKSGAGVTGYKKLAIE